MRGVGSLRRGRRTVGCKSPLAAAVIAVAGLGGGLVACADDAGTAASESGAVPEASAAPRPDLPTTGEPVVDMCSDEVMARMTAVGYELTNHDTAADWCDFEDPGTGRLALLMNDRRLPMGHGAPVRLRVERHLGYKHAKFVMRIEARDRIDNLYLGKGGYWEDRGNYAWYAGI